MRIRERIRWTRGYDPLNNTLNEFYGHRDYV